MNRTPAQEYPSDSQAQASYAGLRAAFIRQWKSLTSQPALDWAEGIVMNQDSPTYINKRVENIDAQADEMLADPRVQQQLDSISRRSKFNRGYIEAFARLVYQKGHLDANKQTPKGIA